MHGGNSVVRHGLRSEVERMALRELVEHHAANPNPLDTLPELARGRALFDDWVNRFELYSEALLAWHESYSSRESRPLAQDKLVALGSVLDEYEAMLDEPTPKQEADLAAARAVVDALGRPDEEGKPRRTMDISDGHRILDTISKIAERIERQRNANAISRADLMRVLTEMGRVVAHHVVDATTREKINRDWLTIRL